MNRPKIYLAGPISSLTMSEACDWRDIAKNWLWDHDMYGITPIIPEYLLLGDTNKSDSQTNSLLATQKAIGAIGRNDIANCDGIIANFLHYSKPSLGTCIQLGQADALRKPVVTVMELGVGNFHDHAMVREYSHIIVPTLEDALETMERWICR